MSLVKQEWKVSGPEARAALGLFRRRQWALALLGVVGITVAFVFLGRWQFHRHEAKLARRDLIDANYDAKPVALDDLLKGPGQPFPRQDEWRPVAASGTYLPERTVLIRNRPRDAQNGYEVVVPLQTGQGLLLIDRGWIPSGQDAARPDSVPAPPAGAVTVIARLRPGEPPRGRGAPPGQAVDIDRAKIGGQFRAAGVTTALYEAYGILKSESPGPSDAAPAPLEAPDVGLGINLAYAVQWWVFAIAAYVLLGVAAVREVRREAQDRGSEGVEGGEGSEGPPRLPLPRAAG